MSKIIKKTNVIELETIQKNRTTRKGNKYIFLQVGVLLFTLCSITNTVLGQTKNAHSLLKAEQNKEKLLIQQERSFREYNLNTLKENLKSLN